MHGFLSDSLELLSDFRQLSKMTHRFGLVPYLYIEGYLFCPVLYPVDFKTICIKFQTSFKNDVAIMVSQWVIVEGHFSNPEIKDCIYI